MQYRYRALVLACLMTLPAIAGCASRGNVATSGLADVRPTYEPTITVVPTPLDICVVRPGICVTPTATPTGTPYPTRTAFVPTPTPIGTPCDPTVRPGCPSSSP